jgi:chaperonin GroEL
VVFPPHLHIGLQRGIGCIAAAVRPTIGPSSRHVAVDRPYNTPPELLNDAGIIARRITDLSERTEDAGAMLLRGLLWKVHDRMGDGVATTAIVFESVYRQGLRYVAAGGDPARLRVALEATIPVIEQAISDQARPLNDLNVLIRLAEQTCQDRDLATALVSVIDVAGVEGRIDVRKGVTRTIEREFVEGATVLTDELLPRGGAHPAGSPIHLECAAILVTDLPIDTGEDVRALEMLTKVISGGLAVFAERVNGSVRHLIATQPWRDRLHLVRLPGGPGSDDRMTFLADIAALTGATPVLAITRKTLSPLAPADLGAARRVWIDQGAIGIIGGQGDPHRLRALVASCRRTLDRTDDPAKSVRLRDRLGRLLGGSATVRIGGRTQIEIAQRTELAERTIASLRAALRGGLVPGGGGALLACRRAVRECIDDRDDPDRRAAIEIVGAALAAPTRAIFQNVGIPPEPVMWQFSGARIVDASTGLPADAWETGILDVAPVLQYALRCAISGGAQALTIGALVQHREPAIVGVEG